MTIDATDPDARGHSAHEAREPHVPPAPLRIDDDRWPGLAQVPSGTRTDVYARVARGLFHAAIDRLEVSVQIGEGPDAPVRGRGGPRMVIHRPEEFFARIGRDGLIGFGEAYQVGAWDVPGDDGAGLGEFLTVLAARMSRLVPEWMQKLRATYVRRPPAEQVSSQQNSRSNISHHYDLSNELFAAFLDPTMSYSAALFDHQTMPRRDDVGQFLVATSPDPHAPASLAQAQLRKIDRLLDAARVTAGTRLLEIGTGWGELAVRAAQRGAIVDSVTLSSEQQALARERVAAAGLTDQVRIELRDYRDVVAPARPGLDSGGYDAIVSVEMIEAVGYDYWGDYFRQLDDLLTPGGRAAIQAIVMPHDRMRATRNTYTWINKYVFPGGFLPSVKVIDEITRDSTALRLVCGADRLSFGGHYAETLRRWDTAFLAAWPRIAAMGFDDTFARMWHFYLEYSRAGFASGYIDVQQLVLQKETR